MENSRDNSPVAETTTSGTHVHTSEVDPVPVKPRRAPQRLAPESGDFSSDDVPIVDGEESEGSGPGDVAPEDIGPYSLAQELLSSDPNYLANTGVYVLHVLCVLCVLCALCVLCLLCVLRVLYVHTVCAECTVCTVCFVCTVCTVFTVCTACSV